MIIYYSEFDVYEVRDGKKHLATEESYVKALTLDLIVRKPEKISKDYQQATKGGADD